MPSINAGIVVMHIIYAHVNARSTDRFHCRRWTQGLTFENVKIISLLWALCAETSASYVNARETTSGMSAELPCPLSDLITSRLWFGKRKLAPVRSSVRLSCLPRPGNGPAAVIAMGKWRHVEFFVDRSSLSI